MNNSSTVENFTWADDVIDGIWQTVNRSPSNLVSYWISTASLIFAILGFISNLMSVVVLIRLSTQLSTFVYLTALSLSDMITCLSIMMTHLLEMTVRTRLETSVIRFLLRIDIIFGAVAAGSRVLSYWISTAVTMDRWILICYPIYGKTFCTLTRARNISRILFLIGFIYTVPLLFEYQIIVMPSFHQMIDFDDNNQTSSNEQSMLVTKGYSDLGHRRIYRWAYMFFNAIFVYTIPTVIILVFNIQLIRALHRIRSRTKRSRQKNLSNTSHQRRSAHSTYSVTIMVIIIVLTLLICRSPTSVLWVLWSFDGTIKIFFHSSSRSFVRCFHQITNLIAIINAATNFLPFYVFGQLFRVECLNIYCCRKPANTQLANNYHQFESSTNVQQAIMMKLIPGRTNPSCSLIPSGR